ncbi:MAG: site-specific DNA-methyltransferase [Armatimonadetes bacterium]|nr:site-specific DNA-methyltransferase [Armatimonadota bacterium]
MSFRKYDFDRIASAIQPQLVLADFNALVAQGDSLSLLRSFPNHSVSLILTDPPYHATKKGNIYGDRSFAQDQHYLDWMEQYAVEWYRVLKPNGSLFCFCDSSMVGRLEVLFAKTFNILSHIVWTKPNDPGFDGWKGKMRKEALRQWYPHSERILFAEPAVEGNIHRSPFANFLRDRRQIAGLSMKDLTTKIGAHGRVNHGGAVSNWEAGRNTPSREQYEKICNALVETGKVEAMPPYEDVVRVFNMDGTKEFTDIWTFKSVRPYSGKHPAEKPVELLEHAIEATTFPDDIVLDCFAGGGNTALAALRLGRRTIAIEIESKWVSTIAERVDAYNETAALLAQRVQTDLSIKRIVKYTPPQMGLFATHK